MRLHLRPRHGRLRFAQLNLNISLRVNLQMVPDEVWSNIVSFFYNLDVCYPNVPTFDIKTLSCISEVNKKFYRIARDSKIWKEYYRSFGKYWKIAPGAKHIGIQTYHRCGLGPYPGWNHIHTEIPNSVHVCNNIKHYDTHIRINKNVRWKDLHFYCAKVTYESITKKNGEWNGVDYHSLEMLRVHKKELQRKIRRLEKKKDITEKSYRVFCKYLPVKKQAIIIAKLNGGLFGNPRSPPIEDRSS